MRTGLPAADTLEAVGRAYRTLLADVMRQLPDRQSTLYLAEVTDLDTVESLYRNSNRWLSLAHAGDTLRLNTPEQAARALARAGAEIEKAAAAEREMQLKERRRRHMPIGMR